MNPSASPPGMRFLSLNAQGLTSRKLAKLISWMKENQYLGAIITETQKTMDPFGLFRSLPGSGALWPGVRFFSTPGTGTTKGVTIILGPSCHLSNHTRYMGDHRGKGRVLRLDLSIFSHPVSLVGVYAPAQPADRADFFQNVLPAYLPTDSRPILMGGDWNCVSSDLDCVYPTRAVAPSRNSRLVGTAALTTHVLEPFHLHDAWRDQFPFTHAFTHFSNSAQSGARLDRWFASSSFLDIFPNPPCSILASSCFATDHLPVTFRILSDTSMEPRGKGIQSFPLLLLNMPDAELELQTVLETLIQNLLASPAPDLVGRWDALKETIRLRSWQIYHKHRNKRLSAAHAADAAAQAAILRLISHTPHY